eukprot:UN21123
MLTVRVYDDYNLIAALQTLDTDELEGCEFSSDTTIVQTTRNSTYCVFIL